MTGRPDGSGGRGNLCLFNKSLLNACKGRMKAMTPVKAMSAGIVAMRWSDVGLCGGRCA